MKLKDYFLSQLERETELSRRVLERVPEGRNSWKPHERSMELGVLASVVAAMPGWAATIIDRDELNFDDPDNADLRSRPVETRAELLAKLDQGAAKGRRALEAIDDNHLQQKWRMIAGGKVLLEARRDIVLSDTLFSHLAHHRGQLTVYLRLNDAAVPAIYGPTADEPS
jgi:uncharacterized damage-inducible protein DinB